jgi:type IV secretion system protein VirB6
MVYFVLIYNWLNDRIYAFGADLIGAVTSWMTAIALVLITLWIMVQGYRMITGQSRESMIGLVTSMVRVVVIVTLATTIGVLGPGLHTLVTTELSTDMNQLFSGDTSTIAETIDKNLTYTQLAMAAIDTVQVAPGDTETAASKARAQTFATFGTASAPMAAAAMLLLYNITLALEIGLAPLFIMCLLFEQTKGLFQKWAMYSIGTLFAMGVLAFVSALVLQLTLRVAGALWTADIINGILDTGAEGFTSQSMQQGGLGLLMTVLVVSAPPIAAMFFQGTMGAFYFNSAFGHGGGNRQGPNGQLQSGMGYGGPHLAVGGGSTGYQTGSNSFGNENFGARGTIPSVPAQADAMKYKSST